MLKLLWQIGVLVGRVDRSADKEVDVRRFLKENSADETCTVAMRTPVFVLLVLVQRILGVFDHAVHGDDTLRHEIDALQLSSRRNVAFFKVKLTLSGLRRYFAAMDEVVPPQVTCLPSLEKKSDLSGHNRPGCVAVQRED